MAPGTERVRGAYRVVKTLYNVVDSAFGKLRGVVAYLIVVDTGYAGIHHSKY